MALPFQQFEYYEPLPVRQGGDRTAETGVIVTMRSLGGRIPFLLAAVDQPRDGCFAKRDLAPSPGGQPKALPAAYGTEPGTESVGVGELVDMFHAA